MSYVHYPQWIADNRLFQLLFLLRKLYLTRARGVHYSQYAEDVTLLAKIKKQEQGFFVDVGCFHPRKYSNTYKLYKRGWRGVTIDLDAIKIQGFKLARPGDVSLCCAISDSGQENVSVYSFGYYTLIQTISRERAERVAKDEGKKISGRSVPCVTLAQALDGTRFRGRRIDYLTVDCEGHDLNVLRSLDWDVYRPRLITVEAAGGSLEEIQRSDIFKMLADKSYALYAWTPPSLHFECKDDGWE